MKYLQILLILMVGFFGCAPKKSTTTQPTSYKKPARCKVLGRYISKNVGVSISRNCIKNGVGSVIVLVFNTRDKGKQASLETYAFLRKTMGSVPDMKLLFHSKDKKVPFFLYVF